MAAARKTVGRCHPSRVRPPPHVRIPAPEFPPGLEWLNVESSSPAAPSRAMLLEFWDFARVNSLRTLPYLKRWRERYHERGLEVVGVHSPGYSFGRDSDVVARAVERLEIPYPVALDVDFVVWRLYGNKGWPGRYLFDRHNRLRFLHYGEGAYRDTELAIQEALAHIDARELPEPLAPLRPEDAPGALLQPQTADVTLPRERDRLELVRDWVDGEDWIEAQDAGAAATVGFRGGEAWAVLSGDEIDPGLHATDGTVTADSPGLRLHGFQFTPAPPG